MGKRERDWMKTFEMSVWRKIKNLNRSIRSKWGNIEQGKID